MPITMMPAKMSLRTNRSRVVATGDSSPPATATLRRSPRRDSARSTSSAVTNAQHEHDHRGDLLAVVLATRRCRNRPGMALATPERLAPVAAARWIGGAPRGLARVRGRRAGGVLVAVFAALSFGPATGGLAAENARSSTSRRSPSRSAASATRCCRHSPAGTPSGSSRSPTPGYADSDVARTAFFPLYPLLCARPRASSAAAPRRAADRGLPRVSLAAFLAALVLLHRLAALELGRRAARPPAAAAGGLPRRRCSSARPTRRASSCSRRSARSRGADGALGVGRRRGRGVGHPQRRAGAAARRSRCLWWQLAAARRRATPPGWRSRPLGLAAYALYLGARATGDGAAPSSRSRTSGRAIRRAVRGRLGRARGGDRRRAPAGLGLARARVLRARRAATRTGWRRST